MGRLDTLLHKCMGSTTYKSNCCCYLVESLETPGTVAHQGPLSLGFPRQGYWGTLAFPSPGALPDPGIEPVSSSLAGGFFTPKPPGKLIYEQDDLPNVD